MDFWNWTGEFSGEIFGISKILSALSRVGGSASAQSLPGVLAVWGDLRVFRVVGDFSVVV